jgi:hypothetical protein
MKREDLVYSPSEGFRKLYKPKPLDMSDDMFILKAGIYTAKSMTNHFSLGNSKIIAIPPKEIKAVAQEINVHTIPLLTSILTLLSSGEHPILIRKDNCNIRGSDNFIEVILKLRGEHESQAQITATHWLDDKTDRTGTSKVNFSIWPPHNEAKHVVAFSELLHTTAFLGKVFTFLVVIEAIYRWREETVE